MIKVFEAFAGYGSQSMALRRLGIDFEVVGISEIDKYAIQAYMAVHGDTPNYGDISKIDWNSVPDFDFLTYSFPCTDISTAGQQKGLAEGSGTRSSLLWECRKAIEAKRPKYLLMENVKNLVSKKFTPYLKEWLRFLEGQGYSNYTKVLNAKDFGVPQNRERVFMVSILGEASFHFPKPFTLEKRLKDVLEKDVDESFYLSEKIVKTFLARNEKNKAKGNGFKFEPTMGDVIASSILTNAGSRDCDNYVYVVGNTNPSGHGMNGNVFDSNGLCPTLTTNKGEGPRILESAPTELSSKGKKYGNKRVQSLVDSGKISGHEVQFLDAYNQTVSDICGTIKTTIDSSCMSFISEPISCALRGRNPENPSDRKAGIELEQTLELGTDIANCITTVQKDSLVAEPLNVHDDGCCRTIKANYYKVAGSDILDNSDEGARFKATGVIEYIPSLYIKQATKKEYIEIPPGGVFDASYPESSTRRGRVQDNGKVSPTLTAGGESPCLYEGMEAKIFQSPRGFNKGALFDDCPTITSSRWQDNNFVAEPQVLTPKRTEYGKALRKDYDAGRIQESRHNMTELEPRTDGICNTITTVQKDNLLMEPNNTGIIYKGRVLKEGDGLYLHNSDDFNQGSLDGISRTLKATKFDAGVVQNYRIRKLTPRECFRLMGVSEKDIDNIQQSGISKTQQYKMAGNSIVVDVLYYIFKKMFVDKSCEDAQLSLF